MSFARLDYGLPKNFGNLAHMEDSPAPDLERLADRVKRRRERLGLRQDEMAGRGGPSTTTLTKVENAAAPPPAPSTLRKLDASLGWTEGSAYRTLYENGEPDLASGESDPAVDRAHYYLTHQPERLRQNFLYREDGFRRATNLWFDIQKSFDLAVRAVELGATVDAAREYLQAAFALAMTSGLAGQLAGDGGFIEEATKRFTEAMAQVATIATSPAQDNDKYREAAAKARAARTEDQKSALAAAGILARDSSDASRGVAPDPAGDKADTETVQSDVGLAGGWRRGGGESETRRIRREQDEAAEAADADGHGLSARMESELAQMSAAELRATAESDPLWADYVRTRHPERVGDDWDF